METWNKIWVIYTDKATTKYYMDEIKLKNTLFDYCVNRVLLLLAGITCMLAIGSLIYVFEKGIVGYLDVSFVFTFVFIIMAVSWAYSFRRLEKKAFETQSNEEKIKNIDRQYGERNFQYRYNIFVSSLDEINLCNVKEYIDVCEKEINFRVHKFQYAKKTGGIILALIVALTIVAIKGIEFNAILFVQSIGLSSGICLVAIFLASVFRTSDEKYRELLMFLKFYDLRHAEMKTQRQLKIIEAVSV